ncbi:hypothetical protein ACOSQ3_008412 [Xanthoceras sorbifolium]
MAFTTSCCLNLSSPTTTHVSSKPTHQLAWHKNEKIRWRRQCVVSISCVIIGLQMADIEDGGAMAKGMMIDMPLLTVAPKSELENSVKVPRWSDKRMPSARRRLESIHYSSKTAPVVISSSNCFSM